MREGAPPCGFRPDKRRLLSCFGRARSSAGERSPHTREVIGSNPIAPTVRAGRRKAAVAPVGCRAMRMLALASWITDRILHMHGPTALALVFLLPALEASAFVGFVFPGEIAILMGGVLASHGTIPLPATLAAAIFGAFFGDVAGYFIGQRWGRQILHGSIGRLPIIRHELHKYLNSAEAFLESRGIWRAGEVSDQNEPPFPAKWRCSRAVRPRGPLALRRGCQALAAGGRRERPRPGGGRPSWRLRSLEDPALLRGPRGRRHEENRPDFALQTAGRRQREDETPPAKIAGFFCTKAEVPVRGRCDSALRQKSPQTGGWPRKKVGRWPGSSHGP